MAPISSAGFEGFGIPSAPIYRIIYHSTSKLPRDAEEFSVGIQDILRCSRASNSEHGITGALMCSASYFAQVIEGEEGAIKALYGNICGDQRHADVRTIDDCLTSTRLFTDWSMAFLEGPVAEDEILPLLTASDFRTRSSVLKILQWFVIE